MIHGPIVKCILDFKMEVLLVRADCPHQLGDVVGVQSAGLCWQAAGQVCVADMSHPLNKDEKELFGIQSQRHMEDGYEHVQTLYTDSSPGNVVSIFPPASAAKSTTTDPSLMLSTMGLVIRMGARLPGMLPSQDRCQRLKMNQS